MPRRQKEITDGSGIHTHPSSGQKLNPAAVSKPGNPGGVEVGSPVLTLMMLEMGLRLYPLSFHCQSDAGFVSVGS